MKFKFLILILICMRMPYIWSAQMSTIKTGSKNINEKLLDDIVHTNLALVKEDIKNGADVNYGAHEREGSLPLLIALQTNATDIALELIEQGANIDDLLKTGVTPLQMAASFGNDAVVEKLLQKGARLNAKSERGYTALMLLAVKEGREDIFENLLKHGAHTNQVSSDGRDITALSIAVTNGQLQNTKLLLRYGADIHVKDRKGNSILHAAVATPAAKPEIVELLLKAGVDTTIRNNEGKTAADYAQSKTPIGDLFAQEELTLARTAVLNNDFKKALHHYQKAYNLSLPHSGARAEASVKLGTIYSGGVGLPRDPLAAHKYLNEALRLNKMLDAQSVQDAKTFLKEVTQDLNKEDYRRAMLLLDTGRMISEAMLFFNLDKAESQIRVMEKNVQDISKTIQDTEKREELQNALQATKKFFNRKKFEILRLEIDEALNLYNTKSTKSNLQKLKKLLNALEATQDPEIEEYSKKIRQTIEQIRNPQAFGKSLIAEEQQSAQQIIELSTDLIDNFEKALHQDDIGQAEKVLRDIKKLRISDTENKRFAILQEQFKKRKAETLQQQFDAALELYMQKPSNARLQQAKNILGEVEELKIGALKDYLRLSYQKLKEAEALAHYGARVKNISPTEETEEEREERKDVIPQEQYLILDPFQVIQQIPADHQKGIHDALEQMRYDYQNASAKKLGSYEGLWRIRVGDYRIVYVVLPQQNAIGLIAIGPRASVYEDLGKYTNREEFFVALNTYDTDELLSRTEQLLKENDAAKAQETAELYRWKVKNEPYDVGRYLKSLFYSGTAYVKLQELEKAQRLFTDLIDQATGNHMLQQQARVGLAQVEQKRGNIAGAREILEKALSFAKTQKERKELENRLENLQRVSPVQEDAVQRLREKFQQINKLLKDSPVEGKQQLQEFLQESAEYAELAAERKSGRQLLDQLELQETFETVLQNGLDELEAGNYQEAREHLQAYLEGMGPNITKDKRQLVQEKLAEISLGQAIEKRKSLHTSTSSV